MAKKNNSLIADLNRIFMNIHIERTIRFHVVIYILKFNRFLLSGEAAIINISEQLCFSSGRSIRYHKHIHKHH